MGNLGRYRNIKKEKRRVGEERLIKELDVIKSILFGHSSLPI